MVFFENKKLQEKYGKGFFMVTDADIVPNKNLPENFMKRLIYYLIKYYSDVTKVGFSLRLDDIPDYYPLKEKVLRWEKQFWKKEIEKDVYKGMIDTTFAMYSPGYKFKNQDSFLSALRIGGNFSATHGGWYINPNQLSEEEKFYIKTVDKSSSWKLNEQGFHDNKSISNYD